MCFTRLIAALAVPMLAVACAQDAATAPDPPQLSNGLGSPPIEFGVEFTVDPDPVNPCTGETHTVWVTGTGWFQPHPNNAVIRIKSIITTSDGYEGRGDERWMGTDFRPGDILKRSFNAMLTDPSGSRIRVHEVFVLDFKDTPPSPPTVRVDQSEAICVQP
jgi:hypothetical protein